MKKTALSLFCGLCSFALFAQGLQGHIPSYAQYIITLNAQSYTKKIDMNTVSHLDFFNPARSNDSISGSQTRIINKLFCKPEDCGIQMLPQAYIFRIDHDSLAGWCYLFSLKDQILFGKFLSGLLQEEGKPGPEIASSEGYSRIQNSSVSSTWTKDFAIVLIRDQNTFNYYDEDESYSASAAAYNQAAEDSIQAAELYRVQAVSDSIMTAQAAEAKKEEEMAKHSKKEKPSSTKTNTPKKAKAHSLNKEEQDARLRAEADSIAYSLSNNGKYANENDWDKKLKEREEHKQKKTRERAGRRLGELMNLNPSRSVAKLRNFTESQKEAFDMAIWMNYSDQAFQGLNPFATNRRKAGGIPSSGDTVNALVNLLKDNYSVAYCNFEQGKMHLIHKAYVNPEMDKLVEGIYRKKGNKTFCKYIKGENLMGYASVSVNPEQTIKATRSILVKTYESTLGKDAKYFTGAMDILSVFTNDDVAYNLFKGDFAIAVTDLRPFKITSLSYTYDDNFNRSETRQEKTEVLPEFVAMASVGKPEEMEKILKAIEKMGGLRSEGAGVYLVEVPGGSGFKIYMALENNILFCTNNDELAHGKLKTGYSRSEQMSDAQRKLLSSWPVSYYWNGKKTVELVGKQPDFKTGEANLKRLNLFKDNMSDATLCGVRHEGNMYMTTMDINFTDTSTSSLFSLCKMINGFYLLDK